MQQPAGMEFDPAQMRNVMDDFWALVLSDTAVAKFTHTVASAWTLAGVFVIGVSCWFLLRKRNVEMAMSSIKVAGWVGFAGILTTLATGDLSAVNVAASAHEACRHGRPLRRKSRAGAGGHRNSESRQAI